ncbi:MAG: EamA family transporter [Proteobacteria bacterium]|nr:EamA family transporter [Pseudomonadota bacterium]
MPVSHLLLALVVVMIWGSNFVVIRWGLAEFSPMLFAALRFSLSSLPLLAFMARPAVAWWRLAAFGLLIGVGQFGLLFLAMKADISPGLASLVVQTQALFTIALVMWLHREHPRPAQWPAFGLAAAGMGWIGWHAMDTPTGAGLNGASLLGLTLVLVAALCWALGNLVARGTGRVSALGFVVWSSLFAVPPLWLLAWFTEGGGPAITQALAHADWVGWAAVAWQAVGNTLFGYGVWSWLLVRHPAATVAPLALLVPLFGMAASAALLGESLPGWKLGAAALVLAGLLLNIWVTRR